MESLSKISSLKISNMLPQECIDKIAQTYEDKMYVYLPFYKDMDGMHDFVGEVYSTQQKALEAWPKSDVEKSDFTILPYTVNPFKQREIIYLFIFDRGCFVSNELDIFLLHKKAFESKEEDISDYEFKIDSCEEFEY